MGLREYQNLIHNVEKPLHAKYELRRCQERRVMTALHKKEKVLWTKASLNTPLNTSVNAPVNAPVTTSGNTSVNKSVNAPVNTSVSTSVNKVAAQTAATANRNPQSGAAR